MMLQMGRHYSTLLSCFLMIGIFLSITSNNWFMMWMGLELNLYAFIPFILQTSIHMEKEAALKYFLAQALASALLLLSILLSPFSLPLSFVMIIALIMKLGAAPCHFWFPSVMNASPWPTCWLLTTVQKIAPLMLLNFAFSIFHPILMYILAALSAIIGMTGAFNQSHFRPLLAYSSIHHIGWILASMSISKTISLLYFISYILISSPLIFFLHKLNLNKLTPSILNKYNKFVLSFIILNMFSLGGQPPFLGFFPKMIIASSLITNNLTFIATLLISTSAASLFFYMKVIIHALFSSTNNVPSLFLFQAPSFSIFISSFITSLSTILFSLLIFSSL